MVRTKDLLLFVVVLVILGMAIFATVVNRFVGDEEFAAELVVNADVAPPHYDAAPPQTEEDRRQATIARLRQLIAKGDVIESVPSVESSPSPEVEGMSNGSESAFVCGTPDTGIDVARQWPLTDVSVSIVGTSRVVTHAPTVVGTTTADSGQTKMLLQLPTHPAKQGQPVCPASEIVGVKADGSLIFNGDAILYKNTSADTLVGYALDGFPIYGTYDGAVDACGGYESAAGYRYAVSVSDRSFVSCFVGQPQPFNL